MNDVVIADRFQLVTQLSAGGMGTVYRALDRLDGRPVAVKIVAPGARGAERFAREARILATLHHPGIVEYVVHGRTRAGELYLAMEWVEGEDLGVRLERGGLSIDDTFAFAERVAGALAAAHGRNVVHRDIKPRNLLLPGGDAREAKLADFGIALLRGEADRLTTVGGVVGTPGYIAPEQARGVRHIDRRADVFSLGCVLFHCLTGRAPFVARHAMAMLAKILLENVPRVRELVPSVPPAVDDLVARMMAKDPAARPADARAVLAELSLLPGRPSHASVNRKRFFVVVLVAPGADPAAARTIVEALGGSVQPRPDGALVATLWGEGEAVDQAAQAARCALALREAVQVPLAIAAGRGPVRAEKEVSERAARMIAAGGRAIHLDELTSALLRGRFRVDVDAAGAATLVEERRTLAPARTVLGKPAPFVGREAEVRVLELALGEASEDSRARLVLLTGAPGVGKTRLAQEFVARVRSAERPVSVWIGTCDPLRATSPFALLGGALRRGLEIDAEPPPLRRQCLAERVARRVPAADAPWVAEFLAELIGLPAAPREGEALRAARLDALLMSDRLRAAWEAFLAGECAAQPVLIVLEDLQWGDLPSVRFVDDAVRAPAKRPLLVLALARPEVRDHVPRLWAERSLQEIQLGPLSKKASMRIARHLLGEAVPDETLARVADRAGGNALFLEELIRSVAAGKAEFPETVLTMVQLRVDSMDPAARRVLRAASVFGDTFWAGGVRALVGGGAGVDVNAALELLVAREVVVRRDRSRFADDVEYAFAHSVVREAAYMMLADEDRARGHRVAADWLEAAGEPEAALLAGHLERGGATDKAVAWYVRASQQALEGNDLDGVLACARRAEACGASGAALGHVRLAEAEARARLGDHRVGLRSATDAVDNLPRGTPRWFAAAGQLASLAASVGATAPVRALAADLEAQPVEDPAWLTAAARVASALLLMGEEDAAGRLAARLDDVATGEPAARPWRDQVLGFAAARAGDHARAAKNFLEAAAGFEGLALVAPATGNWGNAADQLLRVGAYERADEVVRRALPRAPGRMVAYLATYAAAAAGFLGRLDEARARFAEALAGLAEVPRIAAQARLYLAEVLLQAGDAQGAEAAARAAAADELAYRPAALATLARALAAQGRVEEALTCAADAGATPTALLGTAEAMAAAGDRMGAMAAAARANVLLDEAAARISDPPLREDFRARVPAHAKILELVRG